MPAQHELKLAAVCGTHSDWGFWLLNPCLDDNNNNNNNNNNKTTYKAP